MPVPWRLHVLEERLEQEFGKTCTVESVDLYALEPQERSEVLDALVQAHAELPVVLVDGEVACTDDIDVEAIVRQAARGIASRRHIGCERERQQPSQRRT